MIKFFLECLGTLRSLAGDLDFDAGGAAYAVGNGVELGTGYAAQGGLGRGTVDCVDHDFAWRYAAVGVDEGVDLGVGGVVDGLAVVLAAGEHGLYYALGAEFGQAFDGLSDRISGVGPVEEVSCLFEGAVELEYVVVYFTECGRNGMVGNAGGICEDADFDVGKVAVAQSYGVVDHSCEIGVERRLAVAGESDDIERSAVLYEREQFLFEQTRHFVARG